MGKGVLYLKRRRVRVWLSGATSLTLMSVIVGLGGGLAAETSVAAATPGSSPSEITVTPPEQAQLAAPPDVANSSGSAIDLLQAKLQSDFPETFGGLFENADGSFSMVEVGVNPAFEAEASRLATELPAQMNDPSQAVSVSFASGARTLAQLYSIRDSITNASESTIDAAEPGQLQGVWGAGIDTIDNQVIVNTTVAPSAVVSSSSLPSDVVQAESYGSAVRFKVGALPTNDSCTRTCDSKPFYMGDQLVTHANGDKFGCTSGINVYFTVSGASANLTAGHCDADAASQSDYSWYNTNYGNPKYNSSTDFGTATYWATQSLDSGILNYIGYDDYAWAGNTVEGITGWANPPDGSGIENEGSFDGQESGTVTETNMSWTSYDDFLGVYEHLDDGTDSTAPIAGGDSGGLVIYPSGFGPLSGGTLVGTDGSGGSISEEVDALLYVWSAYYGQTIQACATAYNACGDD